MSTSPTCEKCNTPIDPSALRLGWPIETEGYDGEMCSTCPECYGEDAFCACGAVLDATADHSECDLCGLIANMQNWHASTDDPKYCDALCDAAEHLGLPEGEYSYEYLMEQLLDEREED